MKKTLFTLVTVMVACGMPSSTKDGGTGGTGGSGGTSGVVGDLTMTSATQFRDQVGFRFSGSCPAGWTTGTVWGTGYYTDDSHLCSIAAHAGLFAVGAAGSATFEMLPGANRYTGSTSNGVMSLDYPSWPSSVAVILANGQRSGTVTDIYDGGTSNTGGGTGNTGGGTGNTGGGAGGGVAYVDDGGVTELGTSTSHSAFRYRGQLGHRIRGTCSSVNGGTIWGTGYYTDDSELCRAAAHWGSIAGDGGTFTAIILPGAASYTGSTRNGITSNDYPVWGGSVGFIEPDGGVSARPDAGQ